MFKMASVDVGSVIGKNGSTIRQLQTETKTHVSVEHEIDVPLDPSTSRPSDNFLSEHGASMALFHPLLCLNSDKNLGPDETHQHQKDIGEQETLHIEPHADCLSERIEDTEKSVSSTITTTCKMKKLILTGPEAGVTDMIQFIQNLVSVRYLKLEGPEAGISRDIYVDEANVGVVIGKQGSRVQSLQVFFNILIFYC